MPAALSLLLLLLSLSLYRIPLARLWARGLYCVGARVGEGVVGARVGSRVGAGVGGVGARVGAGVCVEICQWKVDLLVGPPAPQADASTCRV